MYKIKIIENQSEIEQGELAKIDIYNWGGEYQPNAFARVCFIKGQGFVARLWCEESSPLARFIEPDSGVCQDSCLEFFACFAPKKGNCYINFEANPNGALLCEYGESGAGRKHFDQGSILRPDITPHKSADEWGYTLFIPLETITAIYGDCSFDEGSVITGSFFKCGDQTDTPHYGSYNKIPMPNPTFHQPQFFAEMVISK